MKYDYKKYRDQIFTDEGQRTFLKIRDNIQRCLKVSGAVRMTEAISGCSGLNWEHMACVDRMVELGEIREIQQPPCIAQSRIFVNVIRTA